MPDATPFNAVPARKHVLVTGAAGRIGRYFAENNAQRYRLRLMVVPGEPTIDQIRHLGEIVEADLGDLDALRRACEGIDACVHMAGDPRPNATWEHLLAVNIVGTYNLFVAALAARCRRVIYASSIHAVSGYPADVQVKTTEPVNPGDLYGVSKCFGEALARYIAEQEGMSAVAVRIGGFLPDQKIVNDHGLAMMDAWVSPRDLDQLIVKSLEAENVKFAVVHGLSNNRFKRLDITSARELFDYKPQDDASMINSKLQSLHLPDKAITHSLSDAKDPRADSGLRDQLPKP